MRKMIKFDNLKTGDTVTALGFDCIDDGVHVVHQTPNGEFYIRCELGKHFLSGQKDEKGDLLGIFEPTEDAMAQWSKSSI